MQPRVWTDGEIVDLMVAEARAYKQDCLDRRLPFGYREMMELVLVKLNEHGLIENTP